MIKANGTILYVGAISSNNPNRKWKTIEASDYFAEQAKRFGFEYKQSEEVDNLNVLWVDWSSIKSWDEIKNEIIHSDLAPLQTLLSELAKQEVSAECLITYF